MKKFAVVGCTFLFSLVFLMLLIPSNAAIICVKTDGSDSNNGLTWDTSKKTVKAALASAVSGDEIWVAQGTYVEWAITMKAGVSLYGGFAGSETLRDQRDSTTNITVLDGNHKDNVIVAKDGITLTTVIDGFTIRNGSSGSTQGGIYCLNGSPTISHNIITDNGRAGGLAQSAIYVLFASPKITDNSLVDNAGYGILGGYANSLIANNTICRNDSYDSTTAGFNGGGIYLTEGNCTIQDNVVSNNRGPKSSGGIYANGTISGNVVSDNMDCGIHATGTISNNLVEGNRREGIWGGGTISGNTIRGNGGIGIRGGSLIAGNYIAANAQGITDGVNIINNTIICNATSGLDLHTSSLQVANNIIASNGQGLAHTINFYFKSNCVYGNSNSNYYSQDMTGTDGNISVDPKFSSLAHGHLQPGSLCIGGGDTTVIQPGWLDIDGQPRIASDGKVDIGSDQSDGRQWAINPIIVRVSSDGDDNNDGSSWVLAKKTVQAALDAARIDGGEVWVKAGTYNQLVNLRPFVYLYGGFDGSEVDRSSRNWKANVTVLDGDQKGSVVTSRGGYYVNGIDGFTITDGSGIVGANFSGKNLICGGGVYCDSSAVVISNNVITKNTVKPITTFVAAGAGVFCYAVPAAIVNNMITDNIAEGTGSLGGGIYGADVSSYAQPLIYGIKSNTIVGNSASRGGGICLDMSVNSLSNNIVASNSSGIDYISVSKQTYFRQNNCVYGNRDYNYRLVGQDLTGKDGNISVDPKLTSDYHLTSSSPCIDAGLGEISNLSLFDCDFEGRVFGKSVDIGADEFWSGTLSLVDIKKATDNAVVTGSGAYVTAKFSDFFYVEAPDRASGMMIDFVGCSAPNNANVFITGRIKTNSEGERYIDATNVAWDTNDTVEIGPLAINNISVGGGKSGFQEAVNGWKPVKTPAGSYERRLVARTGLNNTGLYVRVFGTITQIDPDGNYFYIDDGSRLEDGTMTGNTTNRGVRVAGDGRNHPSGQFIVVTGISSCFKASDGLLRPLIRPSIN